MVRNANPRWARWIYASVAKHFGDKMAAASIHFHVEGANRDTEDKREWFEIRCDGPFIDEESDHHFRLGTEINILVNVIEGDDAYRIHTLNGMVQEWFEYGIEVFKLGDPVVDPENDGSLLGCLTQDVEKDDAIKTSLFGKVRPDTNLIQASVEGHYRMFLNV